MLNVYLESIDLLECKVSMCTLIWIVFTCGLIKGIDLRYVVEVTYFIVTFSCIFHIIEVKSIIRLRYFIIFLNLN